MKEIFNVALSHDQIRFIENNDSNIVFGLKIITQHRPVPVGDRYRYRYRATFAITTESF